MEGMGIRFRPAVGQDAAHAGRLNGDDALRRTTTSTLCGTVADRRSCGSLHCLDESRESRHERIARALEGSAQIRTGRAGQLAGPGRPVLARTGREPGRQRRRFAVRLPGGPEHLGELLWNDGRVVWYPVAGEARELQTDAAGQPSTVEHENWSFFIVDRDGHLAVRLRDRDWAAGKPFAGLDYFDFDPAWQIAAEWQALSPPLRMEVHNVSGELKTVEVAHQAVFEVAGQTVTLLPMSVNDKEVFFVFRDRTSGKETYGAGRFLKVPAATMEATAGPGAQRQNKPRFQPCLQSALRLHALRHLSAAAAGKLAVVRRTGGGEEMGEGGCEAAVERAPANAFCSSRGTSPQCAPSCAVPCVFAWCRTGWRP